MALNEVLGALGFFIESDGVPKTFETEALLRGHMRRDGEAVLVEGLEEDVHAVEPFASGPAPRVLAGMTTAAPVLLHDVRRAPGTLVWGERASVRRYQAEVVVVPTTLELSSIRWKRAEMAFHDRYVVRFFGGPDPYEEQWITGDRNRVKGARFELSPGTQVGPERLASSMTGALDSDWVVDTDDRGARRIASGVRFILESISPRGQASFLSTLRSVQDLIALAFRGMVYPDHVRATVDAEQEQPAPAKVWDRKLMARRVGVWEWSSKDRPLFTLDSVRGLAGLRVWLRLVDEFPRVIKSLTSPMRVGATTPEVRLLDVAAAIESYVAQQRRSGAQWPTNRKGHSFWCALAEHLGPSASPLLGDPHEWGNTFQEAYNDLKHHRGKVWASVDITVLAASGEFVLLMALLNRMARSKEPTREIASHYALERLGERVRDVVSRTMSP